MAEARKRESRSSRGRMALYHALLLGSVFVVWHLLTSPLLVSEEFARNTAFFFGKPLLVLENTWEWFAGGKIYEHLLVTLIETLLAFGIGTALGLGVGLWLALSPLASATRSSRCAWLSLRRSPSLVRPCSSASTMSFRAISRSGVCAALVSLL